MKTLDSPLFEVNQESAYYKTIKLVKDARPRIKEILDDVSAILGISDSDEFVYYGSRGFGFYGYSTGYEKFKAILTKNPDRNGVYKFKKQTVEFKEISPKMLEIEKIKNQVNPFGLHDIFGINNVTAAQWIGDRYFVQVKSDSVTKRELESPKREQQYEIEPILEIGYKDYLVLYTSTLDNK